MKFTHKHIYYRVNYNPEINKNIIQDEKFRTSQKILKAFSPSIKFSKNEIELGENYLSENFIDKNDKIILFGARTGFYRNDHNSLRNSNIQLQIKSMKFRPSKIISLYGVFSKSYRLENSNGVVLCGVV